VPPGTLYLIPSTLGDVTPQDTLPAGTLAVLARLDRLIVETPKQARRFLKATGMDFARALLAFETLNEHTPDTALPALLLPVEQGRDTGLLSDAGCPAVADPGARLVRLAHARNVPVVPLAGPSALLLALMASGLNGQRFAFHGYLPVDSGDRARAIVALERDSRTHDRTQIMIEAPYRNGRLYAALLTACAPATRLCVAVDLTLPEQSISTRTIDQWRRMPPPAIDRRPAVFVLYAGN